MLLNFLLVGASLASGIFAHPAETSPNNALVARQSLSELRCDSPCPACGTQKSSAANLRAARRALDPNKEYCVNSDGSRNADSDNNWSLVGKCGPDNAAIWLQSYIKGKYCLKGSAIGSIVDTLILGCEPIPKPGGTDAIWGFVKLDNSDRWVELGKSQDCAVGNP